MAPMRAGSSAEPLGAVIEGFQRRWPKSAVIRSLSTRRPRGTPTSVDTLLKIVYPTGDNLLPCKPDLVSFGRRSKGDARGRPGQRRQPVINQERESKATPRSSP
jgi:hypothetical protein